jgi:hypothetical protein
LPVALKEKKPEGVGFLTLTEGDIALLVDAERALEEGGGGRDGGEFLDRGGDGPRPQKEWPLIPAVIVVTLIGVLLTFLGMLTQMWANMAGAQLPGS